MAIHAGAMSSSYTPLRRRPGFFRKLVLLAAFVLGISGLMVLLDAYQTRLPPYLMTTFALLCTGLAAGVGARTLFYRWHGFVRFTMALAGLLAGLSVLGLFTNWRAGIGPAEPWLRGQVDWEQLIQLGFSLVVSLVALEAWWKPASRFDLEAASEAAWVSRGREVSPAPPSPAPRQAYVQPAAAPSAQPAPRPRLKLAGRPKSRGRSGTGGGSVVLARSPQKTRSKARRSNRRKPNLQISLYEEHRCPFCFDVVKPNDPRGVKKCEVCNTLHHADCWEVTGFCQVPHLNT